MANISKPKPTWRRLETILIILGFCAVLSIIHFQKFDRENHYGKPLLPDRHCAFTPKAGAVPSFDIKNDTSPVAKPIEKEPSDEQRAVEKLKTLQEILISKDDNDPRLDRNFNELTSTDKRMMIQTYTSLPPEQQNERGTIVYLLGRNLTSLDDVDFLAKVLSEQDCQSLTNCNQNKSEISDDATPITLVYSKVVALKSLERAFQPSFYWTLEKHSGQAQEIFQEIKRRAFELLMQASHSTNLVVRRTAASILSSRPQSS